MRFDRSDAEARSGSHGTTATRGAPAWRRRCSHIGAGGADMATTDKTQQPKKDDKTQMTRSQDRPGAVALRRAYGPFSLMRRMFEDFDRMMGIGPSMMGAMMFAPTVDVVQKGDKLVVSADLPGLSPEDISVKIEGGEMIIAGERRSEHEEREGDVVRSERTYGQFQRVIPLPQGADPKTAEARFENGVLEITLKSPEASSQGHQVEIKTGAAQPDKSKQH